MAELRLAILDSRTLVCVNVCCLLVFDFVINIVILDCSVCGEEQGVGQTCVSCRYAIALARLTQVAHLHLRGRDGNTDPPSRIPMGSLTILF